MERILSSSGSPNEVFFYDDTPMEHEGGIAGAAKEPVNRAVIPPAVPMQTVADDPIPFFVEPYYEWMPITDATTPNQVCNLCHAEINNSRKFQHTEWHRKLHELLHKPRFLVKVAPPELELNDPTRQSYPPADYIEDEKSYHNLLGDQSKTFPKASISTQICVCGHGTKHHNIKLGQLQYRECTLCQCQVYTFSHVVTLS